mmetsp:Transcript_5963/g.19380  ORF Transcript_5963/g.19380 Transcript_5963/m.19380 type:complete len:154 (-) Transcript_5963:46-507(-)
MLPIPITTVLLPGGSAAAAAPAGAGAGGAGHPGGAAGAACGGEDGTCCRSPELSCGATARYGHTKVRQEGCLALRSAMTEPTTDDAVPAPPIASGEKRKKSTSSSSQRKKKRCEREAAERTVREEDLRIFLVWSRGQSCATRNWRASHLRQSH